jgi:hypothetical protein
MIDEIGDKALFAKRPSFSHACKASLAEDMKKHVDLITKLK